MKCSKCKGEMVKGGIVTKIDAVWCPDKVLNQNGLPAYSVWTEGVTVGELDMWRGQVRLRDAYYCKNCGLIIGEFRAR